MTWLTLPGPVKPSGRRAEVLIVGPDLSAPLRPTSCPGCGAALRPDASWCSLCFHDLRPAEPEPAPAPYPLYGGLDPLTAPLLDIVLPAQPQPVAAPVEEQAAAARTWPCTRCGDPMPLGSDVCTTCGAGFLQSLATKPTPRLAGFAGRAPGKSNQRMGLVAAAVAFVVLIVPLVVMAFLLPKALKPKDTGSTPATTEHQPVDTTIPAPTAGP